MLTLIRETYFTTNALINYIISGKLMFNCDNTLNFIKLDPIIEKEIVIYLFEITSNPTIRVLK
jgi:hypothetical protein